jgi:signal transduction histidine kinase
MDDTGAPHGEAVEADQWPDGDTDGPHWSRSLALAVVAGIAAAGLLAPIYMFEGVPRSRAFAAGAILAIPGALLVWIALRFSKRMRRRGAPSFAVPAHVAGGLIFAFAWVAIIYLLLVAGGSKSAATYLRNFAPWQMLDGILLYAAAVGIEQSAWTRQRLDRQRLATTRAQLHALRAQLNPHFLFNALNSIIQLAEEDAVATQSALERLSDLLRHATRTSGGGRIDVTLRDELGFVRNYLALEQLRLGDRLRVVEEIEDDALDRLVPSLILQPIVENAILHAIAPRKSGGTVWLLAYLDRQSLIVDIRDDGPGYEPEALNRSPGMGLNIVRRQLEIRFPGQSELRAGRAPEGGASVRLSLPAHQQAPGASW